MKAWFDGDVGRGKMSETSPSRRPPETDDFSGSDSLACEKTCASSDQRAVSTGRKLACINEVRIAYARAWAVVSIAVRHELG